jgi:hypothetical protein
LALTEEALIQEEVLPTAPLEGDYILTVKSRTFQVTAKRHGEAPRRSATAKRHGERHGERRAADEKAPGRSSTPAVGVASASKGHRFYITKKY